MKKIAKKSILQKTIISILAVILLFNFICPTAVHADFGGVLYSPIQALTVGIGDAIMWLLNCANGHKEAPILMLSEDWKTVLGVDDLVWGISLGTPAGAFISTYKGIDAFCEVLGYDGLPGNTLPDMLEVPIFTITPEKIFANEVPLLDINILNPDEDSAAYALQNMIASWYKAFRNLAVVGLLSVLVYIAIRIIISSTASDKAKYKQMLMDWLIALCLVFFMHYIMSFAITMVDSLTTSLKKGNQYISLSIPMSDICTKYNIDESEKGILNDMEDGEGNLATDFMGYVRFLIQPTESSTQELTQKLAYTIIYITLVIYTCMFTFIYIKRLIYIIFLTIISPLVALTYPLDKISDGKSQAFDMWLKEYVYNLLIQPVHLILYYLLIGSAMNLATKYLIYPLVVLGFLLQAEKILRKFFGFEKGSTGQSFMSGALGGAVAMKGIEMLKGSGKAIAKGGSSNSNASKENAKIRMDSRKGDFNRQEEDKYLRNTLNSGENNRENIENNETNKENINDEILQKYSNDGFGQNADGYYYNPYTDEYDEDYNPIEDKNYTDLFKEENGTDNSTEEQVRTQDMETEEPQTEQNIETEGTEETPRTQEMELDDLSPEETPNIEDIQPEKPSKLSGAKSLAGRYVVPNVKKAGLGLVKGVGKIAGAATLGTIGVAAGLASDDFSNVVKYGVSAGAIGANLGKNAAEKTIELPSNVYKKAKEVQDVYRQGAYSKEEYQKIKNRELDNAFLKNKEAIEKYKEAFKGKQKVNGEDYYKYAMKKAVKYREHGVTDDDTIIKAMKAKSKFASEDIADDRRIVSAKLAKGVQNEKDVENIKNRLKEKNIKQEQINDQAEVIRQIIDIF